MAQAVQLVVRFRLSADATSPQSLSVSLAPADAEVSVGLLGKRFTYDRVFDSESSNEQVVRPIYQGLPMHINTPQEK